MRVTQGMLTGNMLRNLSASYARLGKYQDQLATGKKLIVHPMIQLSQ